LDTKEQGVVMGESGVKIFSGTSADEVESLAQRYVKKSLLRITSASLFVREPSENDLVVDRRPIYYLTITFVEN
jgi:hypothetical protein